MGIYVIYSPMSPIPLRFGLHPSHPVKKKHIFILKIPYGRRRKSLKKSACDVIKMRDYPSLFQGFSFPFLLSSSLILMPSELFLSDFLRLYQCSVQTFQLIILIYRSGYFLSSLRMYINLSSIVLSLKIPGIFYNIG